MRNLKRALSLALSTVMLMGMMVVGTSAASYPDVKASHDAEAIEVMQAIGVMVGDEKGNFNPDQKVTRNEAAVVIAKLMDLGVVDFKGADLSFKDVPEWAAAFVAACQVEGIVSGYSATEFGGNDSVTAVQYALMVMKTLGYFQYESDYGEDWVLATAKQAGKIDLFDGVDVSVNAPLTREQVARITLNALKAAMVESDGTGLTVKGDGFEVTTGAVKYYKLTNSNDSIDADYKTLGEDLFGKDLKKTKSSDDLGRPGTKWTYKNDKVGVYADEADEVVIADDDYATVIKAYEKLVDDDYDKGADKVSLNGDTKADAAVKAGDKIEYFMEDGAITNAVIVRYEIAQIDEIDTEVKKADKADDVTCYVEFKSGDRYNDTDVAGFDADTYVEDAFVLIALNEKDEIVASEIPASVKGEIDAVKGTKVRVDGEYYKNVSGEALAIGDKGDFYLNLAGQVIAFDGESETSENYAYIRHVNTETSKDGLNTETVTAYVILADGTATSYEVEEDSVASVKEGKVVAYSINKDGEFEVETAEDTINAATTLTEKVNKDNADVENGAATAKTEFVFFWINSSNKVKTETATGYKNVSIEKNAQVITVTDDDDYALYVFVIGTDNGQVDSDTLVAVLLDDSYVVTEDADGDKYYTYSVAIDGEKDELVTEAKVLNVAEGAAFEYTLNEDGYVNMGDVKTLSKANVTAANDDYIRLDGKMYNVADEDYFTIVTEYDKDGELDEIYVKNGASLEKGDEVFFQLDDDDLVAVFKLKTID